MSNNLSSCWRKCLICSNDYAIGIGKTFKLRRYLPGIEDFLYESPTISELWREEELKGMFTDETEKIDEKN
jgi:hypothetical protein